MPKLTEQRATLLAAWIAAGSAILAAILSFWSARQVAEIENTGTAGREMASFRRTQVDQLSKQALDSSVELCADFWTSSHILSLSQSSEAALVDQESRQIERLRHAVLALIAMKAVDSKKASELDSMLVSLTLDFRSFSSLRMQYRSAVTNGSIHIDGRIDASATNIATRYDAQWMKLGDRVADLRTAVTEVHARTSIAQK